MRIISAALLAFLAVLAASRSTFAQEAGSPLTIDSRSTIPISVEVTLPAGSVVPTITLALTLDVQALVTLNASEPATATVVLRAAAKRQSVSGGAAVGGVNIAKVLPGAVTVRGVAPAGAVAPVFLATPTPTAAQPASAAASPAAEPAADLGASENVASVNAAANLRRGPGTEYEIVARAEPGELVTVTGQTESGEWLQLAGGAWIAAFLLDKIPAGLAIVTAIPPLPTPAPAGASAGWPSYRLISGDAAFSYPPDWAILDEDSNSATLEPTDGGTASIVITGSKAAIDFTDSAGAIRELKSEMADISDFNFRFRDEGTLPLANNPVYVAASGEYEGSAVGFLAVMAPAGSHTVTLVYFRINQADVTAEALSLLTNITATLTP
jgi:hypothetical protein